MAFKLGDKVVPIKKRGGPIYLQKSVAWNKARDIGQRYLYITGIAPGYYILNEGNNPGVGDFFEDGDFVPYAEENSVKVGDKVVPFQKTVPGYTSFDTSKVWLRAQETGQPYLYILSYEEAEGCWMLGECKTALDGDFFNECDFKPYIEANLIDIDEYYKDLVTKE